MQLAPPRILDFTDAATGAVIVSCPMPSLVQIEACIRLDAATPEDASVENAITRHRRYVAQCVVLLTPAPASRLSFLAWWRYLASRRQRRAWLRSLQYPQLLDLYRKLMLSVQGVDFDTLEQFEAALEAQKKSTPTVPLNPEPTSSIDSENSAPVSP